MRPESVLKTVELEVCENCYIHLMSVLQSQEITLDEILDHLFLLIDQVLDSDIL